MNKWLTFTATVVIAFIIILYSVVNSGNSGVSGAFGVDEESSIATGITAVVAFSFTLFGVTLGALYRRLVELRESGRRTVSFKVLLRQVFASIDFKIGLVGAPIVFGLLWQAIADVSLPGMLIIALQNGFTSHAILREIAPHKVDNGSGS